MWKACGVLLGFASADPSMMECNDPRFVLGSKLMGFPTKKMATSFSVSTQTYTHGSTVSISFSQKPTLVGIRALPRYGYLGDYGKFEDLSTYLVNLNGNCPNTVVSTNPVSSSQLTWRAGANTYGPVDITLLWGKPGNVGYAQITIEGPPLPNKAPALRANSSDQFMQQASDVPRAPQRLAAVVDGPSTGCVAASDGSYNFPHAPVFVQKVHSKRGGVKEITFPAGQCLPCREDHFDDCASVIIDCPTEPGELATEHLFMTEDCSGEFVSSSLPTSFVHCPGPEHYSPDRVDLERLVKKLQRDHKEYFPDEATARLAIAEYRRMLRVIQKFPEDPAVPSKLVDLVWHEHMLDTQAYHLDSQRLFGKYIHHAPTFGDEHDAEVQAEKAELAQQQQQMLEKYKEVFQEYPSEDVWPSLRQPVMGGGRLPDCCQGSCVKPQCVTCVGCNAIDCGKLQEAQKKTAVAALPQYFSGYVPLPKGSASEQGPGYMCSVQPMSGMTLSWVISGDHIYMKQELTGIDTWQSIGFTDHSPYDMGFSDYIVTMFKGNYSGVRDLYKFDAGNHYPCWDVLHQCSTDGKTAGTLDLLDRTHSRANGVSSSSWTRLLNTGDFKDSIITDASKKVMFAHGYDDDFTYHGIDNHRTCDLNFFTGANSCYGSTSFV